MKIQVNKKRFTIRVNNCNTYIGVSVWRNRGLRFGRVFPITVGNESIRKWARSFILENEGSYCVK